jgi:hypothetical protein
MIGSRGNGSSGHRTAGTAQKIISKMVAPCEHLVALASVKNRRLHAYEK